MNDYIKKYLDLRKKHQEELSAFPIAYAFSEKQLQEALEKLSATIEECCTYFNIGDIIRKADVPRFRNMMIRQSRELRDALKDERFAEEAFLYEMGNHEYIINWDGDRDVLDSLGLTEQTVIEMGLDTAYKRARERHFKNAEQNGLI